MSEENTPFKYHPIQLRTVKVLRLFISANPDCDLDGGDENEKFGFYHTHSDYNEETKSFFVKIAAIIGKEEYEDGEEPASEFDLKVELLGVFDVDEEHFPVQHVNAFAKKNAPLIMYPYLREQVYSLTTRAGFDSAVLPLFEIPVFKLQK
jgi:preprotein translocase subunit SecB